MTRSFARGGVIVLTSIFGAVLLGILAYAGIAFAQSDSSGTDTSSAGNTFKVSPLRTDLTLRPGESREVSVFIENLENKTVQLKPIQNDFIAGDDESGTPAIILDEDKFAPTHSLKRFMLPLGTVELKPGERKEVRVGISVPQDAQSGGYYGALRFAPANADGSANVNVSGSVASLIILTVPGNLVESLSLVDFNIQQNGGNATRLSTPENVTVVMRLENKGNVQVSPFGNVSVLKGEEVVHSAAINDIKPAGLVLPDSTRKFEVPVENLGSFGKYTVKATIGYGATGSGDTMEVERTFWIIPSMYMYGAIGALIGLIVLIAVIVSALKSYKRKILRGARRR